MFSVQRKSERCSQSREYDYKPLIFGPRDNTFPAYTALILFPFWICQVLTVEKVFDLAWLLMLQDCLHLFGCPTSCEKEKSKEQYNCYLLQIQGSRTLSQSKRDLSSNFRCGSFSASLTNTLGFQLFPVREKYNDYYLSKMFKVGECF